MLSAVLSYSNVRASVRPSVRPSHTSIASKCTMISSSLTGNPLIYVLTIKLHQHIRKVSALARALNKTAICPRDYFLINKSP